MILFWLVGMFLVSPTGSIPIDNGLVLKRRPIPGTGEAEEICVKGTVDIVFVIDGSTSIGNENFDLLRQFLTNLSSDLPEDVHIAAVQFSGVTRTEFSFNTFNKLEQIRSYFLTMPYLRGTTRIGNALKHVIEKELPESKGNRPDITDIAIIITDGRSSDDPLGPADELRTRGVNTIAIGITEFVDDEQLLAIGGVPENVFKVAEFSKLDKTLQDRIVSETVCMLVTKEPELGEPSLAVDCGPNYIKIGAETQNAFEGSVYVKGHANDDRCVNKGNGGKLAEIQIDFKECGTVRRRSLNPRGVYVENTVIFKFHPTVLTKIDRAFKIQCFYMEADKTVSNELEVSMLTTSEVTQQFPMPTCMYSIRSESPDGPQIRFAIVGQKVFHRWECDNTESQELFKMKVHSCFVDDGNGDRIDLIDEDGCSLDKFILKDLSYNTNGMTAVVEAHVFKFRDREELFFQCQISLCVDLQDGCQDSPPTCPAPRIRRSASLWEDNAAIAVDVFTEFLSIMETTEFETTKQTNHNQSLNLHRKVFTAKDRCLTNLEFFCFIVFSFGTFVFMFAFNVAIHVRSEGSRTSC